MASTLIYFVETPSEKQRFLLCRWVDRFHEAGRKVQVLVDSTLAAQHLDQMLWTFSQESFIPHRVLPSKGSVDFMEPVVITVGEIVVQGFQPWCVTDRPPWTSRQNIRRLSISFCGTIRKRSRKVDCCGRRQRIGRWSFDTFPTVGSGDNVRHCSQRRGKCLTTLVKPLEWRHFGKVGSSRKPFNVETEEKRIWVGLLIN